MAQNPITAFFGRNKKQESLAVLIGKDDHKIYVYQLNQGVSQEKAEAVSKEKGAGEIDKITLAVIKISQFGKSSQALLIDQCSCFKIYQIKIRA